MAIRVGIIGGGGYTAGELLRILVHHPSVEIAFVWSDSQAGKPVAAVHRDLVGDIDMVFSGGDAGLRSQGKEALGEADKLIASADVLFLCMGHGRSVTWMAENEVPAETVVVDLSADFRLNDQWVYGLPELNRESIRGAKRIANPGCFATAIQLALLPLVRAGLAEGEVHVNGITGSTGAGQKPLPTTHFSWRNANVSVYKAFTHQHLAEIGRSVRQLGRQKEDGINFIPVRGPFARGIFVSCYVESDWPTSELRWLFNDFYAAAAFTHPTDDTPNLKQVVNTNKGLVYVTQENGKALVLSVIDNLLKGASGQAVQNMNLALGLEEAAGLRLKAGMF